MERCSSSSSLISNCSEADEATTAAVPAVHRARINFRGRLQGVEESVGEYAAALRLLTAQCEYTSVVVEDQLQEQFLFGLKSKAVQDKLCEEDGNVTVEKLIDIATAAETFQAEQFGFQHPLSNGEIQNLLTPHLDEDDLFHMRQVSKSTKRFSDEELARLQKRLLRENRWSPVPFDPDMELDDIFGRYSLCLSSPSKILEFIQTFGENGSSATGWPFFGEGVVQIKADYEEHTDCSTGFCANAIRFLELFGSKITVLIWINGSEPICSLNKKLKLVPNLRDFWVEGFFSPNEYLEPSKWPKLPHLNSIRFCRLEYDETVGWEADHLVQAYGSQVTALNIGTSSLHVADLLVEHPSDQALLLNKVRDFSIRCNIDKIRALGEYPDWKLKRLSLDVFTRSTFKEDKKFFKKFSKYVAKSGYMWNIINKSRESLEEVYITLQCDWKDFVQLFLLPVCQNARINSAPCKKVRKLSIPAMSVLRAGQVAGVVRKKFPNVEHLEFNKWVENRPRFYEDFVDRNAHLQELLPEWARDLYFDEVDFEDEVTLEELPGETLDYFWDELAALQKITVLDHHAPHLVVYTETRK